MNVLEWAVNSVLGSKFTQSTGAIDVIAIRKHDGSMSCSPFHVKLGKVSKKGERRVVTLKVNGKEVSLLMKLGPAGEAFFVERSREFIKSRERLLSDNYSSSRDMNDTLINKTENFLAVESSVITAMLTEVTSFTSFSVIAASAGAAGTSSNSNPYNNHYSPEQLYNTTCSDNKIPVVVKSRIQRSLSESDINESTTSLQGVAKNEKCVIENETDSLPSLVLTSTSSYFSVVVSDHNLEDRSSDIVARSNNLPNNPNLDFQIEQRRRRSVSDMSGLLGTAERSVCMGSEFPVTHVLPQIEHHNIICEEHHTKYDIVAKEIILNESIEDAGFTGNNQTIIPHTKNVSIDRKEESMVSWIWQWGSLPVKSKSKSYNDLLDVSMSSATNLDNAGTILGTNTINDTKHEENIKDIVTTNSSVGDNLSESTQNLLTPHQAGSSFSSINSDNTITAVCPLQSSPALLWRSNSIFNSSPHMHTSRSSPLLTSMQKHQVLTTTTTSETQVPAALMNFPAKFPWILEDLSEKEKSTSGKMGNKTKQIDDTAVDSYNLSDTTISSTCKPPLHATTTHDSFELQVEAIEGSLSRLPSFPCLDYNYTGDISSPPQYSCDHSHINRCNNSSSNSKEIYELAWKESFSDIHRSLKGDGNVSLFIETDYGNTFTKKSMNSPLFLKEEDSGYDVGTGYISTSRQSSPYDEILKLANANDFKDSDKCIESSSMIDINKLVPTYMIDSEYSKRGDHFIEPQQHIIFDDEEGTTTTDNDNLSLQDIDLEDISPEPAGGDFYDSDTDSYLSLSLEDGESGGSIQNREQHNMYALNSRSEKNPPPKFNEDTTTTGCGSLSSTENRRRYKKYRYRKVLVPTQEQLNMLELKDGENQIEFHLEGCGPLKSQLFVWPSDAKIVVTDLEGICTGKQLNIRNTGVWVSFLGGGSYSSSSTAASKNKEIDNCIRLFANLHRQGYRIIYISQSSTSTPNLLSSKDYLSSIKASTGECLPPGPIFKSPESLVRAFGASRTDVFKAAALRGVKSLFPNNYNPYHACFCTRESDAIPFARFGFPEGRIFLINDKNEIKNTNRTFKLDFARMNELIQEIFPLVIDNHSRSESRSVVNSSVDDSYNDFNYWKIPYAIIDDGDEY